MPLFTQPIPFAEALQSRSIRSNLPTTLGSRDLSELSGEVKRLANFSARMANAKMLDAISSGAQRMIDGELDPATFRQELQQLAKAIGARGEEGELGTIKDFASEPRTALIGDTTSHMADSYGNFAQGQNQDVLDAYPAQELYRAEERKEKRDWEQRWREAARAAGDEDAIRVQSETGRMIALKDSQIWDELGNPANFDDALGNPFPPFAFTSGMDVRDVARSDAIAIGLMDATDSVEPRDLGIEDLAKQSLELRDQQIGRASCRE